MAKSGISVSSEVETVLARFAEGKADWVQVIVANETFQIVGESSTAGAPQEAFEAMRAKVLPKEATYFIFRIPSGSYAGKFVVVFHCPDAAKVKDRMVYASSIAALKKGFGDAKFASPDTYRTSHVEELDYKHFVAARSEVDVRELLTNDEWYKKEAEKDSVGSVSGEKVGAILQSSSNLKVKPGTDDAVRSFGAGSFTTVIFRLDPDTELFEEVEHGNISFEDVSKKLDKKEPRYVLVRFVHQHDGESRSALVFLYYCPDTAKPKLKMFYSSAKQMVIQYLGGLGVNVEKKFEASDPAEVNDQAALDELYPKVVEKKAFAKPKSLGSRGAKRGPGVKFSAGPVSPSSASSPLSDE